MTQHAIIEQLYKSKDLDDCIKKTVRQDHQADFKHELILLLYEKPADLILSLYNTSGLTFYVVRIVLNLVNQKRNIYHRTYNDYTVLYDTDKLSAVKVIHEEEDFEHRLKQEDKERAMIYEIENNLDTKFNTFYYRQLIEAVDRYGGIRATARALGIPKSSVHNSIKKVKDHLNKMYNDREAIDGVY